MELGEVDGTLLKSNSDAIVDVTTIVFRRAPVKSLYLRQPNFGGGL